MMWINLSLCSIIFTEEQRGTVKKNEYELLEGFGK